MNPFLARRSGTLSRFNTDPELVEFLNNVDRYYTVKELIAQLVARFGSERTPSKSAIYRYLQKITRQTGEL
jgi:hypothetical protein